MLVFEYGGSTLRVTSIRFNGPLCEIVKLNAYQNVNKYFIA